MDSRAPPSRQSARSGSDVTRCTLYILLPICILFTLFLVWQGIPQTLGAYVDATTLEGAKQTIAVGPVASQVAIKMLGTNGGGFFNANAAHPFENPTALSNFVQMVSIFALGAALTNVFGRMVGDQRQGWAILSVMAVLFLGGVVVTYGAEAAGNPLLHALGVDGGNMEGKEVRFGVIASALFAVITTDASCGAVNAMHDSFTALGGMIPLINIELGEVIVGGVGLRPLRHAYLRPSCRSSWRASWSGRTPEYLGKKIEAKEVKMAVLAILCLPLVMLGFTALASVLPDAVSATANPGPHGFSEILLRLHIGGGQQRVGLRWSEREHALLQCDAGDHDARRPFLGDRAGDGDRGFARREKDHSRVGGHTADAWRPVRWARCRRDPDRRRSDIFPRRLRLGRSSSNLAMTAGQTFSSN